MSKTDPSSSNAAGDNWPGRADGDAGRQGATRGDQPEPATRPARDVDDSWALSGAMAVPNVPGLDGEHGEQPAPPLIPAAAPSGNSTGREAAASVVARAAALRALGAKTMQGLGPAPINRGQKLSEAVAAAARQVAAETAAASAAVADLEEEPTHFTGKPSSSSALAASAAVAELVAEAPTQHAPAAAATQAPLYLDDPPDMLRLSTGTSDISVPEIDPGVSATMAPGDGHAGEDDGGYSSESAPYPESSEPFPHDDGYSASSSSVEAAGEDEAGPDEDPDEHDGHDDTRDDVGYQSAGELGYGHAAPEAMPPAAQLVAPTTAALRAYGSDGVPRAESSDWFEPSGGHAQQIADASPYGHTVQQNDFSFTEPSRRRNPPGPNRWIAPLAVVVALAAVVFAGVYFYTRGSAAPAGQTTAQAGGAASAGGTVNSGGAAAGGAASGASGVASSAAAGGEGDNAAAPSSTVAAGLVDVRFDSNPPGAMVMLVDRGRGVTSPVGTTPVRAALEPKGTYDAIFTLEGHPTKVISLAGPKAARVVAELSGAGGEQVATAPVPANPGPAAGGEPAGDGKTAEPAGKTGEPAAADGKGAPQVDKRDGKAGSSRRDKRKPGRPSAGGGTSGADEEGAEEGDEPDDQAGASDGSMGSLSISAKPPCEIAINGKSIGRTTPVKDFPLAVGIHKITFINKSIGVNETIAVRVTAGKETKVAQDYTGTP